MSSILTNNDVNRLSNLAGDYLNARTHGNFVGNGTFRDTENLQNLLSNVAFKPLTRSIFLPSGIYYIHHPLNLTSETRLFSEQGPWSHHGAIIRPSVNFDVNYNPNGVKASMLQGQMDSDPTGQNRWTPFNGNPWFGGRIENISLENSIDGVLDAYSLPTHRIANLNGISLYYPAETATLRGVYCAGFETSYWVSGVTSGIYFDNCSSWGATQQAFLFDKHPIFIGSEGPVRILAASGDFNATTFFMVRGTHQIFIDGPKFESPINLTDNIITVDTPTPIDAGQAIYPYIEMRSASCALGGGTGSHAITNLVEIKKTGTANPAEYPLPAIKINGGFYYAITNIIKDNTNGVIIPAVLAGQGHPRLECFYCASPAEPIIRYNSGAHRFLGSPIVADESTVANAPAAGTFKNGQWKFSNGRRAGEGVGAGTGIFGWSDGVNWRTYYDNTIVAA